eukprot:snap_masked-scaffold_7-processed-gene-11.22-mRNA-1 protein AED:1.00 eAED:1.00 QI:0/0/0/0/1/1/2/0/84
MTSGWDLHIRSTLSRQAFIVGKITVSQLCPTSLLRVIVDTPNTRLGKSFFSRGRLVVSVFATRKCTGWHNISAVWPPDPRTTYC